MSDTAVLNRDRARLTEQALEKAAHAPEFLAFHFRRLGMQTADLMAYLGCPEYLAEKLGLCWAPRAECFEADVQAMSQRFELDRLRLTALLRTPARCGFCRHQPSLGSDVGLHYVACTCGAEGPPANSPEKALDSWAQLVGADRRPEADRLPRARGHQVYLDGQARLRVALLRTAE